ncbi:MAG: hypothetical protein WBE26_03925 [Phycisphaerae bacterium]
MKLTEKDRTFLELLRELMQSHELSVELKVDRPSYMILRGTYGDKINRAFRMTRQGVRWRFQRVMTDIYTSAFESILFIERTFGTELRDHAIRISKERYKLRQEMLSGRLRTEALSANGTGLRWEKERELDERPSSGKRR